MANWPPPDTGDDAGVEPDRGEGMPRWVKVSGLTLILVVLAVVLVMVIGGGDGDGGHGPGRHSDDGPGGRTPTASVSESGDPARSQV